MPRRQQRQRLHIVPATSLEAYASMESQLAPQEQEVRDWVKARGAYGATREEIVAGAGIKLQSVTARVTRLLETGKLRETTETRRTASGRRAAVLVATVPVAGTQLGLLTTPEARVR